MTRLFLCLTAAALLLLPVSPAAAQQSDAAPPAPEMPDPIKNLAAEGAQVRYLGRDYGLDGWITVKNGQEQYFYATPDGNALLLGLLFDSKGKMVTMKQVQKLQSKGDDIIDSLATDPSAQSPAAKRAASKEFQTPGEKMFDDITNSNWIPVGSQGAPIMYAFIDPQCPHCHAFINAIRKEYIEKGRAQLRIIPVGFRDETVAQAAYLLAAPNPVERWFKFMDGDASALPAKKDISDQGVQRNLAIMHEWKFDATPMIVYRAKSGTVKIVRGEPTDAAALINDLGARS